MKLPDAPSPPPPPPPLEAATGAVVPSPGSGTRQPRLAAGGTSRWRYQKLLLKPSGYSTVLCAKVGFSGLTWPHSKMRNAAGWWLLPLLPLPPKNPNVPPTTDSATKSTMEMETSRGRRRSR